MICAVVLAAGRSERMGTQKLLLPIGGKTLIERVVDELLASAVEGILVVVGDDSQRLRTVLGKRPIQFVPNPDPTSDMLGSVRCGLRSLPVRCEAVLVVLGDQPGISHELVDEMIHRFRESGKKIISPSHDGHRGHPILFSTKFCDEVTGCHGTTGLRGLLDAHPEAVLKLKVESPDILEDMDTPVDYQRQKEWFTQTVRPLRIPRGVQSD